MIKKSILPSFRIVYYQANNEEKPNSLWYLYVKKFNNTPIYYFIFCGYAEKKILSPLSSSKVGHLQPNLIYI